MAQPLMFDGTREEIKQHEAEFEGKRVTLYVHGQERESAEPIRKPRTLLERFGDAVGSIEGSGAANSENTGEAFPDYLLEKRQHG